MQAVLGKVAESTKMSSADRGKAAEGTNLSCRNRMQDQKVRILAPIRPGQDVKLAPGAQDSTIRPPWKVKMTPRG